MPPESPPSAPPDASARRDPKTVESLWPWLSITALYIFFVGWIVFDRWSEIGSLFEPPKPNEARLPLHNIGDLLAGIFAPLAFLWLFVATLLQRKELRLQREELAETRSVLAEQQRELERAAVESSHQTEIMRQTLDATMSKSIYDEFNLQLYFLAKTWVKTNRRYVHLDSKEEVEYSSMYFLAVNEFSTPSQETPSSIDSFYDEIYSRSVRMVEHINSGIKLKIGGAEGRDISRAFKDGMPVFRDMIDRARSGSNLLVRARSEGLLLNEIYSNLEFLHGSIRVVPEEELL